MLPFGLQPWHLIAIAFVALLIFGPARLPEIGRNIGKAINEFRQGAREMTESIKEEVAKPTADAAQSTPTSASSQTMPTPVQPAASFSNSRPVEADKQYCIHCGSVNPANAVYCNHCGSKIAA
jgi:sec-independent protein translocase protein TatA